MFGWDYVALLLFLSGTVIVDYIAYERNMKIVFRGKKYVANTIILRMAFLVLWFMAAFRGLDIGNDTQSYFRTYQKIARKGFLGETRMEKGYVILNLILAHIFDGNVTGFHVLVFITSFISYTAVEQWIEKHTDKYGLCIITFYFFLNHVFMSTIRQSLAAGLVLWSMMAWEEMKGKSRYVVSGVLIVIAASFHATVLIALIIPLIAKLKFSIYSVMLILGTTTVATLMNLTKIFAVMIGRGTSYINAQVENAASFSVTLLFYAVILFLRFVGLQGSVSTYDARIRRFYSEDFYTYCICLSIAISILSLRMAGLSRLTIYFDLIWLPYISNVIKKIKKRKYEAVITIVFASMVWWYSVVTLVLRPEWAHIWPYHSYLTEIL